MPVQRYVAGKGLLRTGGLEGGRIIPAVSPYIRLYSQRVICNQSDAASDFRKASRQAAARNMGLRRAELSRADHKDAAANNEPRMTRKFLSNTDFASELCLEKRRRV